MQAPPTVFSQINSTLFHTEFSRCVERFPTLRKTRGLSEYDHFLALCFGQLTYRDSLRDIVACLNAKQSLLYHIGFRGRVTRTNLAYANKHRNWRLFAALAEILMRRAGRLYEPHSTDVDLPNVAFALDASIIALSLNLFPWGYYSRTGRAALKLHLLLSLKGNLPAWGVITEPHVPDMKLLDQVPIQAKAFYIMDRGYLDFVRLFRIHQQGGFFLVRCKHHVRFTVRTYRPVDKEKGLRCDQTVGLTSSWSKKLYPEPLRKIRVYDAENKVVLILLTNNFALPSQIIADLYRRRWRVELFFKWIKQHLRVHNFYGRSENAVRCQIWSAICVYLMVAILKKELESPKSLYELLQIISVNIFEQIPLDQLLITRRSLDHSDFNASQTQKLFIFNDS